MANTDFGIIQLDYTDSTNNYAMQLINDDKAHPGLTIVAQSQLNGKGQRGRSWVDVPGESLLMSVITTPKQPIWEQFVFSASVAVSIANVLQMFIPDSKVQIKWPNDIIINDKKAGGILIENVLHGSHWANSIIGLGLNVGQVAMPDLPHATSLKMASGKEININTLRDRIREHILSAVIYPVSTARTMQAYNDFLYKKDKNQLFSDFNGSWEAKVLYTRTDGAIEVQLTDGSTVFYHHGQVKWEW